MQDKLPNFDEALQELQTKSASEQGKTAIFFSGDHGANMKLAEECQEKYPDKSYTINQTEAGKFLHGSVMEKAVESGIITNSQYEELWNEASRMFARESKGGVIAFMNGELRTGNTFVNNELPILLNKNAPINWIDTSNIMQHAVSEHEFIDQHGTFKKVTDILAKNANCFDDPPPPPSGNSPVLADGVKQQDGGMVAAGAFGASHMMGDLPTKAVDGLASVGEYGIRKVIGGTYEQPLDKIFERNAGITTQQIEVTKDAHPESYGAGEVAAAIGASEITITKAVKFIPASILDRAKAATSVKLEHTSSDFSNKTPTSLSVAALSNDKQAFIS